MKKAAKRIEVTEGTGNVFEDVGLPNPEEALAKAELARLINALLAARGLSQVEAGKLLKIPKPRVSDLARGRLVNCSLEKLMVFARRFGMDIEIRMRRSRKPGLRVPNAKGSPDAYARWLDAARRPGRMLLAQRPSPYSHTVTKETASPWVGSVLTGAPNYLSVEANFNVPTAVPLGDETTAGTAIAIWDGLGGFSGPSGGLIQAGVGLETAGIVAIYDSWREYCCGDGDSNGYGGAFTPNPGDAIYDQNWFCDASGNIKS